MNYPMVQTGGEKILLTLWIGALWTIGFIAVPILFASIEDKQIAGLLAGKMFTVVSYIGLFCGLVLLISELRHSESLLFNKKKNKRFWLLIVMLVLVIIGEFLIQPQMAALKQSGLSVSPEFDQLHGIATTLYMLNCLLGLILVIFKPE